MTRATRELLLAILYVAAFIQGTIVAQYFVDDEVEGLELKTPMKQFFDEEIKQDDCEEQGYGPYDAPNPFPDEENNVET